MTAPASHVYSDAYGGYIPRGLSRAPRIDEIVHDHVRISNPGKAISTIEAVSFFAAFGLVVFGGYKAYQALTRAKKNQEST